MSGTVHKEFRPLVQTAEAQGWSVTQTRKNHLAWRSPTGALVITAGTPSDRRALQNAQRWLRHNGLVIP